MENVFYKIRLFALRRKEPYSSFYAILGFVPHRIELYRQALTHRSAAVRDEGGAKINNERLEFLGDAVFTAVTADVLYRSFPDKHEGFLSNLRSRIIRREMLNRIAIEIGLDALVQVNLRTISHNNYIYGNAFEALIGAIYLDCGYERCKDFIERRIIKNYIDLEKETHNDANYKSKLVEWGQSHHLDVTWEVDESLTDEDNNPIFKVHAVVGGVAGKQAMGYSKKEAQQKASQCMLRQLRYDRNFSQSVLSGYKNESDATKGE